MTAAKKLYETLLDQWKSGKNAELKLHCENGSLKVTLHADLGPWAQSDCLWSPVSGNGSLHKANPSPGRLRRRERRAAERAAAEMAAAEKATTDCAANLQTAAEEADAQRAVAVKDDAKKASAEKVDAKISDLAGNSDAEKTEAEEVAVTKAFRAAAAKADLEVVVEKPAPEKVAGEKSATANGESASTSCLGIEQSANQANDQTSCWNCDAEMTAEHQCKSSPGEGAAATANGPPWRTEVSGHRPSPSAPVILKGKVRMLDGSPAFPSRPKRAEHK